MSPKLLRLQEALEKILGIRATERLGELTVEVEAAAYKDLALSLRDHPDLRFEEMIDLCGVDYQTYGDRPRQGGRYASVVHLLSITHNWRLRVRAFCADDNFPMLASLVEVWPSADWFEREAFDLYGIVYDGHTDLRRILTDYGFAGHPFRKDFPLSGYVEMRYDPEQKRVIYQPVSIEPREVTPRIVRAEHYAEGRG
ncbi:MAG: NADH-quinone oxidoreductase subunit C [Betaproteobacteria bacterium]|nr:NADH-quinone oxidoreductase subunit C [Betaproteobacteria bacterium]MSQ88255.1 NADH-quinone oxidoreductase subunit C [Betaproteobacteria bacterium]